MIVLLSPAKAIDMSKTLNCNNFTAPVFMSEAESLIKKLQRLTPKKIGALMHLSADLSDLNYTRYQEWENITDKTDKNIPVAAAFNGEVYKGLDAPSMSEETLEVAQGKVRILSGLYGILKPKDVIFPYRLEMGTKFEVTPKKNNLYKFWGDKIAKQINEENQSNLIVNLASNEYFKAVDKKTLIGRVITPTFKELKNGEYKVIMVFAKKARGLMARYIVDNDINNADKIKNFDVDGYRFDENLSEGDNWVFTR